LSGGRAALAAQTLGVMGYSNVVSVDGAFADLQEACR
jgi:rhodanese-related sulfurtransferase